jgi:hypothetical protein
MSQAILYISEEGKIVRGRDRVAEVLAEYSDEEVLLTFEKIGDKITKKQLGFYWAAIIKPIEKELGWEQGTLHEYLKRKHNPKEQIDLVTGEIVIFGGSTQEMSKERMQEYIRDCILELEEFGFEVETPEHYFKRIRGK